MKVLITDQFDQEQLAYFPCSVTVDYKPAVTYGELVEIADQYDVFIISTRLSIDPALIEKASRLKLIIRLGIGVDHIHLQSCKNRGIMVANTPNSNITSVVELVFGQIIREYRSLEKAHQLVLQGHFRDRYPHGNELRGKTLGIVGVGRIGTRLAEAAKVFCMNVIGYDPYLSDLDRTTKPVSWVTSLEQIALHSDIVTFHVPLTDETRWMINREFLSKMRNGSLLINMARGKVARWSDLLWASENLKIRKYILDVFEEEPFHPEVPDHLSERFYFSPHIGALTAESLFYRSEEALVQLNEYINGQKIHGFIDPDKGY